MISAFSDSCKTAPKAGVSIKQLYLLVSKLLGGKIKGLLISIAVEVKSDIVT
jgi:hypothetical protein